MQQIQLNIIPFKPVVDNQTFAFYGEKQTGFAPIYWDKLFFIVDGTTLTCISDHIN